MPFTRTPTGLRLHCRLTPRSARDAISGLQEIGNRCTLKCAVRAVPEDGKANRAIENLIARWLGVPKTSVNVVVGNTSRRKTLEIAGSPDALEHDLNQRLSDIGTNP